MMSISNDSIRCVCVCVIQLYVAPFVFVLYNFLLAPSILMQSSMWGGSVRSRNLIFCNRIMMFLFFYIFLNILADAVGSVLVSF